MRALDVMDIVPQVVDLINWFVCRLSRVYSRYCISGITGAYKPVASGGNTFCYAIIIPKKGAIITILMWNPLIPDFVGFVISNNYIILYILLGRSKRVEQSNLHSSVPHIWMAST